MGIQASSIVSIHILDSGSFSKPNIFGNLEFSGEASDLKQSKTRSFFKWEKTTHNELYQIKLFYKMLSWMIMFTRKHPCSFHLQVVHSLWLSSWDSLVTPQVHNLQPKKTLSPKTESVIYKNKLGPGVNPIKWILA